MSVRLLIDMNLSPQWVPFLTGHGWDCVHWSTVGDSREKDIVIMQWALAHEHVVFTHDLDFGRALALTHAHGPSVLQVRAQDVLPDRLGPLVVSTLRHHEPALENGALVVIDERRSRVRVLPI